MTFKDSQLELEGHAHGKSMLYNKYAHAVSLEIHPHGFIYCTARRTIRTFDIPTRPDQLLLNHPDKRQPTHAPPLLNLFKLSFAIT